MYGGKYMYVVELEPTAALVMSWAKSLYNHGVAAEFMARLDLSSGEKLLRECDEICDWYAQVLLNRKFFMQFLIENILVGEEEERIECPTCVRANPFPNLDLTESQSEPIAEEAVENNKIYQLIILAAGKSPMALCILENHFDRVKKIFEIDEAGMEQKNHLYKEVAPNLASKISCITGDITSDDISRLLISSGYERDIPSIILMEGISYYVSIEQIDSIIRSFKSAEGINRFIIEYLVPYKHISRYYRSIAIDIFELMRIQGKLDKITNLTAAQLGRIFARYDGDVIESYTMKYMEQLRTDENEYFKFSSDGWIEALVAHI